MDNKAGAAVGSILGFINGIEFMGFITWTAVAETMVITFVGGIFGWLGSEFMKFVKKQIQ